MFNYPYGDSQQINLNWIISEIIALHQQLDPDYAAPSFTQIYPFSDTQQLNLDWILTELKALKELAPPAPELSSNDVSNESTVSGDTVTDALDTLLTAIENLDSDDIDNESTVSGTTVTNALSNLNGAINNTIKIVTGYDGATDLDTVINHALTQRTLNNIGSRPFAFTVNYSAGNTQGYFGTSSFVVICAFSSNNYGFGFMMSDSTKFCASFRRSESTNYIYQIGDLNDAITSIEGSIATIQTTNIAVKTYKVGEYFLYNGILCRVTAPIAQGESFTAANNVATTIGEELYVTSITYNAWSPLFLFRADANYIYIIIPCGNLAHKASYTVTGTINLQLYPLSTGGSAVNTGELTLSSAEYYKGSIFMKVIKPSEVTANIRGLCTLLSALTFST